MSDKSQEQHTGTPSQERYGKLLRGEITSEQYVKDLQNEARAGQVVPRRSAKSGTFRPRRSTGAA